MKRIGIFGGAFNPPHIGHVRAAEYAFSALELDRLFVIPSCESPHKELPGSGATNAQRLQMLKLCFDKLDRVEVTDLEIRRGGISYTCETVEHLRRIYPDDQLLLCLGADKFLTLPDWRGSGYIMENAHIAVLCRGIPEEQQKIVAQKQALEAKGTTVYLLENPVTQISSTDMRRLLSFECADAFLPGEVADYIKINGLYGFGNSCRSLPMERLEQVVISLLKPSRVKHVLGCRDTAVELARQWGADETDAARAGLLHDITKALDGPLQLTLCRAYGTMLDDFSVQNPKTLHALTGSLVAREIFGENDAVVSAIRSHTTGKAGMNLLEKIIYVADYMEPNRDFPGVEELRQLAFSDIDLALKTGLEMTIAMLRLQKREISKESQEALQWLDDIKNLS